MENSFKFYAEKLAAFADVSRDGYAIFTANDQLLCANQAFINIFFVDEATLIGLHFTDIMRSAFHSGKGPRIDTEDIESWLSRVSQLRRSRDFRLFEVDLVDGRWFLFSEQTLPDGEMLLQTKDITKQKIVEQHLNEHSRKLANLALTDELTQIANRRSFVASVQAEITRCSRLHCGMAFFLLDIDHFKSINDSYGHQAGDEVLRQIARLVKSTLREYDIFGRIGGEEFGIFLSETTRDTALEVAERLRQQVAEETLFIDGHTLGITISVGIALAKDKTSFEQLYADADAALYQAKRSGRNRVVVAEYCVIL
ncbi:GGDEF domain-containing protein [Rheinheimera fenheensis]|uniref:GGDEF domain-containing protein n=1 Tax=Rheinheimera fenheensis TaxID=3152295 RepID=UPI0032609E33